MYQKSQHQRLFETALTLTSLLVNWSLKTAFNGVLTKPTSTPIKNHQLN